MYLDGLYSFSVALGRFRRPHQLKRILVRPIAIGLQKPGFSPRLDGKPCVLVCIGREVNPYLKVSSAMTQQSNSSQPSGPIGLRSCHYRDMSGLHPLYLVGAAGDSSVSTSASSAGSPAHEHRVPPKKESKILRRWARDTWITEILAMAALVSCMVSICIKLDAFK